MEPADDTRETNLLIAPIAKSIHHSELEKPLLLSPNDPKFKSSIN